MSRYKNPVCNYSKVTFKTIVLIILVCQGALQPLFGQQSAPLHRSAADRTGTMNFTELAQQDAQLSPQLEMEIPAPVARPGQFQLSLQPGDTAVKPATLAAVVAPHAEGFVPALRTNFSGLPIALGAVPPDTQGAVGPEHLLITLNSEVAVQDRQGKLLSKMSLSNFWSKLGYNFTYDPKVVYDHLSKRFVVVTLAEPRSTNSALLVAVSKTSDPTGDWRQLAVVADSKGEVWLDYPNLGYNHKWFVVTVNTVGVETNEFRYASIFAFNKQDLYGGGQGQYARFGDPQFTVVPAVSYGTNIDAFFLVTEGQTPRPGIVNHLRLSRINGNVGNESYVTNAAFTAVAPEWSFSPGTTNFAPQLGTTNRIYSNDSRIQTCVLRDGKLWCAHHIFLQAGTALAHSAVQWWQLGTNGVIGQWARIDDTSGKTNYLFPSLAVNRNNDVLVGFSLCSSNQYASAAYTYRLANDSPNTMRPVINLKSGLAPYKKAKEDGRVRWGDFSSTVVDPLNDVDMWTLQEYAELPDQTGDRWGTWWGYVGFQPETPPTITAHPVSKQVWLLGTNVTLEVAVVGAQPLQYLWRFNGTNLSWTTNAALVITNFQPGNVGLYSVVVSNVAGYATSAEAELSIVPPSLTLQPKEQITRPWYSVSLSVAATGTEPLYYQWMFNGNKLAWATNSTLEIPQFQAEFEGEYYAVVTNAAGTVTSNTAKLILARVQLIEIKLLPNGYFQFVVASEPGDKIRVEYSSDLVTWRPLTQDFVSPGEIELADPSAKSIVKRFYRAILLEE